MRKLIFKTNYNILLWHFVDEMSKWSNIKADHLSEYFEKDFGFTEEDNFHLEEYAKFRKPFDWHREADFFEWAYLGFPVPDEFELLLPHILHFNGKVSSTGIKFKDVLEERLWYINGLNIQDNYERILTENDLDGDIEKMFNLFEIERFDESGVVCFLPCSMSSDQRGSANGWAIYTEVGVRALTPEEHIKGVVGVVFHEYLHKVLKLREYLKKIGKYQEIKWEIFPAELSLLFEEAIVYLLSDVRLNGSDIVKKISQYEEITSRDENMRRILNIWITMKTLKPILDIYLDSKNEDPNTFRKELFCAFDDVISQLGQ